MARIRTIKPAGVAGYRIRFWHEQDADDDHHGHAARAWTHVLPSFVAPGVVAIVPGTFPPVPRLPAV